MSATRGPLPGLDRGVVRGPDPGPSVALRSFSVQSVAFLGLCAVLGLGTTGCGDESSGADEDPPLVRLLPDDPSDVLSPASLRRSVPTQEWQLEPVEKGRLELDVAVELEAAEVSWVEIAGRGRLRGGSLSWAGPGQELSQERTIGLTGTGRLPVRWRLASNPLWTGRIARLRVVARPAGAWAERSARVRAGDFEIDEEALNSELGAARKLNLYSQFRNAVLTTPARGFTSLLPKGRAGELRFSYAVDPACAGPLLFVVSRTSGRDGSVGDRLFAAELAPPVAGAPRGAGWQEARVPIDALPDDSFLHFSVEAVEAADAPLDAGLRVGAWGHPEIVTSQPGKERPLNVVLISLDTVRADHLSLYGYGRETSPVLDEWARRRGVVFENAVAQAPLTLPSHVSMFTGLNAHRHGVGAAIGRRRGFDGLDTAAEILRDAGYATFAVTGGGNVDPRFGFGQGFDVYRYWQREEPDELVNTLEQALGHIDLVADRPFFFFFHTYSVHSPYVARQPWFGRWSGHDPNERVFSKKWKEGYREHQRFFWSPEGQSNETAVELPESLSALPRDLYDSGIGFMDSQLRRLLERLEEPDLAGRTLVIVTSDHGEELGGHGVSGHGHLWESNLLVPLIVALPDGAGAGTRIAEQVRSIDLLPTILDVVGLPRRADLDGVSLIPTIAGESGTVPEEAWTSFSHSGVSLRLRNRLKLVYQTAAWRDEDDVSLYDLTSDPGELEDMSATVGETTRIRDRLQEVIEAEAPGLRIRFENDTDRALRATIRGRDVGWETVTAAGVACGCASFEPGRGGVFDIEPGRELTVLVEMTHQRPLEVEASLDGGPWVTETVTLEQVVERGVDAVFFDGAAWARGEPPEGDRTGLSFWFQGDRGGGEVELDEGLRERLRALGYL